MKKYVVFAFSQLLFWSITPFVAQEKVPLLTGKVKISIAEGTFDCDLTLQNIPQLENYFLRLNSGMNILHFKSVKPDEFMIYYDKSLYDTLSTGESNAYFFPTNDRKSKFLPEAVRVKYVGKFPVVADTIEDYSRKDWKGNIAFNHNSVRTDGMQTAWYPVLYDIENDKTYEHVRYDLEIVCEDCSTLYVNGNAPVKATHATLKSDIPQELTLFCGDYDFSEIGETYILNPGITDEQIREFSELINTYKAFYTQKLSLPFDQPVTFVQTTPTSRKDGWLYVSYPTIVSIGWGENGLESLFDPRLQNWYRPFIAHELGHYYFGNYKVFNADLGDMMSEGFAEYLALQLTKELIGKEVYTKLIRTKIEDLKGFNPVPFGKVRSALDYNDRELYVYYYAPMIFSAIEKEIGEERMWEWLKTILMTPVRFTNYQFLVETLEKTLADNPKQLSAIKATYFETKHALKNAIKTVEKNE